MTVIPSSAILSETLAQAVSPFSVDGAVVWVTGASGGIGAAIVRRLAEGGARLVLQARSAAGLEALGEELRVRNTEFEIVTGSVTDPVTVQQSIRTAIERWGRLDGLVACAGVSPIFKPAESIGLSEWREVMETNVTGTFLTATEAGRAMLEQGRGSIVIVSSVHGTVAGARLAAYSTSKGAVNMLAKSLAAEWASRGVRVNVVAPGYVETDMTSSLREHHRWGPALLARVPMGRFAEAGEISGVVQFLLSDAAAYMTGTVVEIDGGYTSQ